MIREKILILIGKIFVGISFLIIALGLTFGGWLGLEGKEGFKAKQMLVFLVFQGVVGIGLWNLNKVSMIILPAFCLLAIPVYVSQGYSKNLIFMFTGVFMFSLFNLFKLFQK